jgi:hypothetical protein
LTTTRRPGAAGTIAAASRFKLETPDQPWPRTSFTIGRVAAITLQARFEKRPSGWTCASRPPDNELIQKYERGTAGEQVAAIRAAVDRQRKSSARTSFAENRRSHGHAAAKRFPDRAQVRLEAERRKVEWIPGAAQPALNFIGNDQRARRLGTPC